MNYCKRCGAYIPDTETKCLACGYESGKAQNTGAAAAAATATATAAASQANSKQQTSAQSGEYRYKYDNKGSQSSSNTAQAKRGSTTRYSSERRGSERYEKEYDEDATENMGLALLCYLGPLLVIPMLTKKDSEFVKFHSNQGLNLLLLSILAGVASFVPVIGPLASFFGGLMSFVGFFSGIFNVLGKKRKELPFIGKIKLI